MNAFCKRIFDVLLATIGLLIAVPGGVIIALLIQIDSPGSLFFVQERLGLHGRPFKLYKFRKFPARWRDEGPGVTVACDARMTKIGAFLERTKLDELPQLWNILKGDMSFVGPRPESMRFADLFTGKYANILNYFPGIFGPNQIAFRNESELYPPDEEPEAFYRRVLFHQKADADLAYFGKATWLTDLFWIVRGVWVSFIGTIHWRRITVLHARILILDFIVVDLVWTLVHLYRFEGTLPQGGDFSSFKYGLLIMPAVVTASLILGGCYRQPLRYYCFEDAIRLFPIMSMGWLLGFVLLMALVTRQMSFYLIPMGWFTLFPLLLAPRAYLRLRKKRRSAGAKIPLRRILIYGIDEGILGLAALINNKFTNLFLVGFIHDDALIRGRYVSGCRVLGRESDLETIHKVHQIDELWLTFLPDEAKRRRLENFCYRRNIHLVFLLELEPFARVTNTSRSTLVKRQPFDRRRNVRRLTDSAQDQMNLAN